MSISYCISCSPISNNFINAVTTEQVIPETAQTDHVIHAPQEHAGAGQVSEEALKTVLPGHDMGLDVVEAHVAVEQQLATPNDSPPAGESMSNMPVADLHDKACFMDS